jgi:hypothetical protein
MIYPIKSILKIPSKGQTNQVCPFFKLKSKTPNCKECRYSHDQNGTLVCCLFKYSTIFNIIKPLEEIKYDFYLEAKECRTNDILCGPDGKYFKEK